MARPQDALIPHYIRYLQAKAKEARRADGSLQAALRFCAHLFAVACQLVEDGHDLRESAPSDKEKPDDLAAAIQLVLNLEADVAAVRLYAQLRAILEFIDQSLCSRHDDGIQGRVQIDKIRHGKWSKAGGTVLYWVRRPRIYRRLCQQTFDDAEAKGASTPPSWLENPIRHLDQFFCYWKRDTRPPIVSRARPDDRLGPLVSRAGHQLEEGESLKIALCPLIGEAFPCFELTEDWRDFRTSVRRPMVEPSGHSVREQLQTLLDAARQNEVHLLVLPELTVDLDTRNWLAQELRTSRSDLPFGIVAGSFHIDKEPASRPYNESHFLDEKGGLLLEHWKAGRFRITKKMLLGAVEKGMICCPPSSDSETIDLESAEIPNEIEEHIEPGEDLYLLETSFAQLAVLICADAIDVRNHSYMRDLVIDLMPDLVLIPAMSFETDPFDQFEELLLQRGIGSFFVNAHCICGSEQTLASISLDQFQTTLDQPTRLRWRKGLEPEAWNLQTKRWKPFSLDPRQGVAPPFSWLLDSDRERLGLVADLGAYWV